MITQAVLRVEFVNIAKKLAMFTSGCISLLIAKALVAAGQLSNSSGFLLFFALLVAFGLCDQIVLRRFAVRQQEQNRVTARYFSVAFATFLALFQCAAAAFVIAQMHAHESKRETISFTLMSFVALLLVWSAQSEWRQFFKRPLELPRRLVPNQPARPNRDRSPR